MSLGNARNLYINGEALVAVRAGGSSVITSSSPGTQLGLAESPIQISLNIAHDDVKVDAWGQMPPEVQVMLASADITMALVHFDWAVLHECVRLSMGGATTVGQASRAGTRMGNNVAALGSGNHFIGLGIANPGNTRPWYFPNCYLFQNPITVPLGNERSIVQLHWRAIPYVADPWNGGVGANGLTLFEYTSIFA